MKFVFAAVFLLVLIATPVLAQQGKNDNKPSNAQGQEKSQSNNQGNQGQGNQEKSQESSEGNRGSEKKEEKQSENAGVERAQASTSPGKKINTRASTATSSGKEQCDPNYPWKNHGEYVSCVAKSGAGGEAVAEAARSDIGKKNEAGTPSASVSPTASGSAIPSISPSPEATSSGLITSISENLGSVREVVDTIADQFAALISLLNPFD